MPNQSRSRIVTSPSRPSVARKAKASGTPAKFEATPEKVVSGPRIQPGSPPIVIAQAMKKPIRQPSSAEATLIRIEIEKAARIDGWNSPATLAKVNPPSGVRNAPTTICIVGRIRNSSAKARNGTTPSQAQDSPRSARAGGAEERGDAIAGEAWRAPARRGPASRRYSVTFAPTTLSHSPVIDRLHRLLVVERREHRLLVGRGRRQRVEQLLRHHAARDHVVEADRVAVALEPAELALVGIEVLHPQLGRVRMRRVGADRLHVDARDHARGRHHHLDRRVAGQRVAARRARCSPTRRRSGSRPGRACRTCRSPARSCRPCSARRSRRGPSRRRRRRPRRPRRDRRRRRRGSPGSRRADRPRARPSWRTRASAGRPSPSGCRR